MRRRALLSAAPALLLATPALILPHRRALALTPAQRAVILRPHGVAWSFLGSSLGPFSLTRASPGTYTNSAGVLTSAGVNVPRYDYSASLGQLLGLLYESQSTNDTPNNTMQGATAGVYGSGGTLPTGWQLQVAGGAGTTVTIVDTAVEDGIDCIDVQFSGTSNGSYLDIVFNSFGNIPSSGAGQTWTGQFYSKYVGGSSSNITSTRIQIQELTGSTYNAQGITAYTMAGSSTPLSQTRQTLTYTTTISTSDNVDLLWLFDKTPSTAINFTARLGLPQTERGTVASSSILTPGSAATRYADVLTCPLPNGKYQQTAVGRTANPAGTTYVSTVTVTGGLFTFGWSASAISNGERHLGELQLERGG